MLSKTGKQLGPGKGNQNGKGNIGKKYNVVGDAAIIDGEIDKRFRFALERSGGGAPYSPEVEAQAERMVGISAPVLHDCDALPSDDYDTDADLTAIFAEVDEYDPELDPDNY